MTQRHPNGTAKSPHALALSMVTGFMASRAISVAAELGLADLMAEGPLAGEALAAKTRTHGPALHRLLRALVSFGWFDEIEPGCFGLTSLGDRLRTGVPGSLRNFALLFGSERAWRSWGDLLYSVRTGESAATHLYGMNGFDYFEQHPEQAAVFNAAMAENTLRVGRALVEAYDFTPCRSVVDVGGGNGALLAIVLSAYAGLGGTVFDLPSGCSDARRHLEAAGLMDRSNVIEGDFFKSVPPGADVYILKNVIHDWDDRQNIAILESCRRAMPPDGRLLVVERLMPETIECSVEDQLVAMMDMNMLVMPGGRERTQREFVSLLDSAGLRWIATHSLKATPGFGVVEATRRT